MGTWTTPVIAKLDGHDQIVCFQPNRVVSYKPKDGAIEWFCKFKNPKGDLAYSSAMIGDGLCIAMRRLQRRRGRLQARRLRRHLGQSTLVQANAIRRASAPA